MDDEWIKKMQTTHTAQWYSSIKSNEIMLLAQKSMKPKVVVLRRINQSHKEEQHGLGCLGFFFSSCIKCQKNIKVKNAR